MVNITHKSNSLRTAVAQATVTVSKQETIHAIENNLVPKGNVFEMAKTAGLFAVKKTSDVIPDCHPLPIEYTAVEYAIEGLNIYINLTVSTIYKTGVEVEAMHGASVIALTMYDMLKPIDKGIEINNVKLLNKKGGKSDFKNDSSANFKAVVVVCSDTISAGKKEDKAGLAICDKLKSCDIAIHDYTVIPDEFNQIQAVVKQHSNEVDFLIFTGGTGLSPRDVTPEAIEPLLDRRIPGIEEAIRTYGQQRTPYSMLSRSIAGNIGNTLVLALPGSTNGAKESMEAIFPAAKHLAKVFRGGRHD